jgi:hypothetical protein
MTDDAALLARFREIRRAVFKESGEAGGRVESRVEAMRAELRSRDRLRMAGIREAASEPRPGRLAPAAERPPHR